jgi:hypothetical protein
MKLFEVKNIGKPAQWLIEAAKSVDLDYSTLTHETTDHFVNHVKNRHGQGTLKVIDNDFEHIPIIVANPDVAIIGAIREDAIFNAYTKRIAGETYIYFDKVLNSKRNKALRGQTFYKIKKPLDMSDFENIVTMNSTSDISQAKKI